MAVISERYKNFSSNIVSGMTQGDAYIAAGYKVKVKVAKVKASVLMKRPEIKAEIARLRAGVEVAETATRMHKRKLLKKLMDDTDQETRTRIQAVKVDNLMTGDNKPVMEEGEWSLHAIYALIANKSHCLPNAEELALLPSANVPPSTHPAQSEVLQGLK